MREPVLGIQQTLEHQVTADDFARFDGETIHELYGTASVVRDMEHVARLQLLPLLEPGEGSVGREVLISHLAPVSLGETVRLRSTIASWTARTLTTDVVAFHEDRVIAEGYVVQGVVSAAVFASNYRSNPKEQRL